MAVHIVETARTPHGTLLGGLAEKSVVELGATALAALRERADLPVDHVFVGQAIQAATGQVPGRQSVVEAGFPVETPVTTVNEASGSGVSAIHRAFDYLTAGRGDVVVAGGQESMTNAPFAIPDYRTGVRYGDRTLRDTMIYDALWDVSYDAHMGELTEGLVAEAGISRERQDQYAVESNRRAAEAIDAGRYDAEIVPVETSDGTVERDEGPRPNTTVKRLGKLPPAFEVDGTIHAGNASKLADGAGFVALTSDDGLGDRESLCRVTDVATAYRDPKDFNKALAAATEKLLEQNDLTVSDVDRFDLNEAFAAQMVYVMDRVGIPREKLNPDGGAVAFGHPIGASGGMLPASLASAMRRDGLSRTVTGMSVGGGGGVVVLLER